MRHDRGLQEVGRTRRAAEDIPPDLLALTEQVIGAAVCVHRSLGPGFLESVYANALGVELGFLGIVFRREVQLPVFYRDIEVGSGRCDFLVADRLVLELKATESLSHVHRAQLISYLKATQLPIGLILNFNVLKLTDGIRRCVNLPSAALRDLPPSC